MGNGLCFDTGRDVPPGMQKKPNFGLKCPYCGTLMQLTDQPEASQGEMVTDWFFVCAACGSRSPIIHVKNPLARIFNVAEMIHKAFPMEGIEWRSVEPGEEL